MIGRIQPRFSGSAWCLTLLASVTVAAVVLISYWPVSRLGFYADDWIFYDLAGRLSLPEYLTKYLDPRLQTAWYRPLQGMLFRLEFVLWGPNPFGYHFLNVVLHLVNCLLLFLIVRRVTGRQRMALIAAMLFASLPTAALAVFWPGVVDTLETSLILTSTSFWLSFVSTETRRAYWFAFGTFILALLTKEIAASLPIFYFLIERYWGHKHLQWTELVRRYAWFIMTWIGYVPIEYIVTQRSVFLSREGYQIGLNALWNLINYLSILAFPWAWLPWLRYAILGSVIMFTLNAILSRKNLALIPLVAGAVLTVLPVSPFPVFAERFLYMPLLASVTVYAGLIERLFLALTRRGIYGMVSFFALGLIILDGGETIWSAAANFGDIQKASYGPFLSIATAHPSLPGDTLFYFIDPPIPGPTFSGMFLFHYGRQVSVGANDSDQMPRLRDQRGASLVFFDERGSAKELSVEKDATTQPAPALPVNFNDLVTLDAYEVTRTRVKQGDDLGLLLHWRVKQSFDKEYSVFVRLVDARGKVVVAQNSVPREWHEYASRRKAGEAIVDAHMLTIPVDVPSGTYRIEVELSNSASQALPVVDTSARAISDGLFIESFVIGE